MEINGPDSGAFIRLGARNMLPRPCEQKASELKANATHGLSMTTWPSGAGGVYQSDLLYPALLAFSWYIQSWWCTGKQFHIHGFL